MHIINVEDALHDAPPSKNASLIGGHQSETGRAPPTESMAVIEAHSGDVVEYPTEIKLATIFITLALCLIFEGLVCVDHYISLQRPC